MGRFLIPYEQHVICSEQQQFVNIKLMCTFEKNVFLKYLGLFLFEELKFWSPLQKWRHDFFFIRDDNGRRIFLSLPKLGSFENPFFEYQKKKKCQKYDLYDGWISIRKKADIELEQEDVFKEILYFLYSAKLSCCQSAQITTYPSILWQAWVNKNHAVHNILYESSITLSTPRNE